MTMNYTIHRHPERRQFGARLTAPLLTVPIAGQRLALGTASTVIPGPCEIIVQPDEDVWLDIRTSADALNPAASPLKLTAGVARAFEIAGGDHFIMGSAA